MIKALSVVRADSSLTLEPHGRCYFRREERDHSLVQNPSVGLYSLMPTVLRVGGFSVRMYATPREHRPPHVHVVRSGTEVIILLGDAEHLPTIRERRGMHSADARRARELVTEHQGQLLEIWRKYHG